MATAPGENIASKSKELETLSLEKLKAISSRRNKKPEFIPQLPSELITENMKYFKPYELIKIFSVSEK